MTCLSVNVNKIATLRNARGGNLPNVLQVAKDCERFGAEGITVHPRPDQRHITYEDVYDLSKGITTEFNVEGYPNEKFMELVLDVKPAQVTLVPDPPGVLTSNAGWNTIEEQQYLQSIIEKLSSASIRTSIFIETDLELIRAAADTGVDRIEFYTGPYAEDYKVDRNKAVANYEKAGKLANELKLGINAGHDLNLENLEFFKNRVNGLLEVSIGHALIADALYFGLENTVQMYRKRLL